MLENLDSVKWDDLTHAYGPATDVPGHIRDLVSADQDLRAEGISLVTVNLVHQGGIYEATSYAVPFLYEVAGSKGTHDRHDALSLIGTIAEYASRTLVRADPRQSPGTEKADDLKEWRRQETNRAKMARQAVRDGVAVAIACLEEEDATTAAAAAYVLSQCREDSDRLLKSIRRRFECSQDNPILRTALAFAGAAFVKSSADAKRWMRALFDTQDHVAVRLNAALALSSGQADGGPKEVLAFLGSVMTGSDELDKVYQSLPWLDGEPSVHALNCLFETEAGWAVVMERLRGLLSHEKLTNKVTYTLHRTLEEGLFEVKRDPMSLPARGVAIMRVIADCDRLWSRDGSAVSEISRDLRYYHKPTTRDALYRLINQASA